MLDLEDQIARLASARAEQVEPWRPAAPLERNAPRRRRRRWDRRAVLAGAGLAAAAAIIAVILVPDDDGGTRVTTTVPSTTEAPASTSTVAPFTTTSAVPRVATVVTPTSGAPGTPFSGTSRVRDNLFLPGETQTINVWFVTPGAPRGVRIASASAGQATIEPTGEITFSGTVPQAMGSLESSTSGRGAVFATEPGTYELALGASAGSTDERYGFVGVEFTVTARGTGLPEPVVGGHVADPARALLGPDRLAGVPFGTGAEAAIAALLERFGPPDTDRGWEDGCDRVERHIAWGGLTAGFTAEGRAADVADGTFAWFGYWPMEGGSTAGLETASGVRLGTGLSELRGRVPEISFGGPFDGLELVVWSSDDGLSGELSADVTSPDSTVVFLSAGDGPALDC